MADIGVNKKVITNNNNPFANGNTSANVSGKSYQKNQSETLANTAVFNYKSSAKASSTFSSKANGSIFSDTSSSSSYVGDSVNFSSKKNTAEKNAEIQKGTSTPSPSGVVRTGINVDKTYDYIENGPVSKDSTLNFGSGTGGSSSDSGGWGLNEWLGVGGLVVSAAVAFGGVYTAVKGAKDSKKAAGSFSSQNGANNDVEKTYSDKTIDKAQSAVQEGERAAENLESSEVGTKEYEKASKEAKKSLRNLEREEGTLTSKISDVDTKIAKAEAKLAKEEQDMAKDSKEINDAKEIQKAAAIPIEKNPGLIADNKSEIKTKEADIKTRESKIASNDSEITSLNAQINDLYAQETMQGADIAAIESKINEIKLQITKIEEENVNLKKANENDTATIENKTQENEKLNAELEKAEKDHDKAQEIIVSKTKAYEAAKARLSELKQQKTAYEIQRTNVQNVQGDIRSAQREVSASLGE